MLTLGNEALYCRFLIANLFFIGFYFVVLFLNLIEKLLSFVLGLSPATFDLYKLLFCKTQLFYHFRAVLLHFRYLIFIILHISLLPRLRILAPIQFTLNFQQILFFLQVHFRLLFQIETKVIAIFLTISELLLKFLNQFRFVFTLRFQKFYFFIFHNYFIWMLQTMGLLRFNLRFQFFNH